MRLRHVTVLAAVALLILPSAAFATQIVVDGVGESIVEGHTTFALIEKARFRNETIEAAAVAVLVRERIQQARNFKGVLWFNDQYILGPGRSSSERRYYPCGGAVVAVNTGDPVTLDGHWAPGVYNDEGVLQPTHEPAPEDFETVPWTAADDAANGPVTAETLATLDPELADPAPPDVAYAGSLNSTYAYNESYLVTDPNDHSWVVDKYVVTTVDNADPTLPITSVYPMWVVNLYGEPVFRAKNEGLQCGPYVDDPWEQAGVNQTFKPILQATGAQAAIGYYEPTDDAAHGGPAGAPSYCYDGNENVEGYDPGRGCDHGNTWKPAEYTMFTNLYSDFGQPRNVPHALRTYNALLYFFLGPDDVRVTAILPHRVTDTNGCEAYTEWHCPTFAGSEDDDAEGNSHPFNPPGLYVPAEFDPNSGSQLPGTGNWYDVWAANRACSMGYDPREMTISGRRVCMPEEHAEHARGRIDLYYSPTSRPLEPQVRAYRVLDYEGRIDQFHENNANPAAAPTAPYHPGQPDTDVGGGLRRPSDPYDPHTFAVREWP